VRDLAVSYAGVYLFLGLGLALGLIILTSRANLVLRVIWQCDIFGMTSVLWMTFKNSHNGSNGSMVHYVYS